VRLKRLRLSGFKSFVDPTELRIEQGLTGVVGPNGCGKSNLFEALRWVMGESSPKSLRGAAMDDVIFAGTQFRPARSFADVTILIDNSDRRAPAAFNDADELEVSRRIERDAGSAYRINGRDARQRDVQLLFADAATGAHSPALVSQGRVGAIITAKPVDRRAILEEAAGISGLHSRRKEAEQKLRAADANLARLDDVLTQLEAQAVALKRQARQAERYRQLSGEIRSGEAQLLYRRWHDAAYKLGVAEQELRQADALVADLSREQARITTEQANLAAELPALRHAEADAAAGLQRLTLAQAGLEGEARQVAERIARLEAARAQIAADLGREDALEADGAEAMARLAAEQAALVASVARAAALEGEARQKVGEAAASASDCERELDQMAQRQAEAMGRHRTVEQEVATLRQQVERLRGEQRRLQADFAAEEARTQVSGAVDAARTRLGDCEAELATVIDAIAQAEQARETAEAEREAALTAQRAAQNALTQFRAELAGVDRLLAATAVKGPAEPVLDSLRVAAGYEKALAAALSEDLDAPLGAGPRHWSTTRLDSAGDPPLAEGLVCLADHVQAPAALARRLAQIGVVAPEEAARHVASLKVGQRLVSTDGQLWRWDGFAAVAPAKAAAGERLTLRNRREALLGRQAGLEADAAGSERAAAARVAAHADALNGERAARARRRDGEAAVDRARQTLVQAEQEAARRTSRLEAIGAAQQRLADDLATRESALAGAEAQRGDLPDLPELAQAVTAQRAAVERLRAALASARAEDAELSRRLAADRGRLSVVEKERADWLRRVEDGRRQAETLRVRDADASRELDALAARPDEIERARMALLDQIATAEAARREAADRLALAESVVEARGRDLREVGARLTEARERRARIDAMVENLNARRQELAAAIGEAYQCPPPMLPGKLGWDEGTLAVAIDVLEQQHERAKAERERLGAVNLRADIELEEIVQRRDTSLVEKSELEQAIAKLRGSIGSLNREGRQRLLEAFKAVDSHFQMLFKRLFGGGDAHLALVESDDPLEAGLEIMASPPGKKLQHLGLLSGGEQALTAIALIFAVFLTNPSPICVLDEVDAPLDDANVERFCDLLDEMVHQTSTRFLVVTHNAVTMSRMNRLFGVTMAERGVSQLVSVDLGRAERLLAAE